MTFSLTTNVDGSRCETVSCALDLKMYLISADAEVFWINKYEKF